MKRNGVAARVAAAILAVSMIVTDALPAFAEEVTQTTVDAVAEEEIKNTVNGVSTVIGFDGRPSVNTLSSEDGTVNRKYAYTNWNEMDGSVYVRGTKTDYLDSYTGYYKYGDELFFNAVIPSTSVLRLHNRIAWHATVDAGADASAVIPKIDSTTGFYLAPNGKYYIKYSTRNVKETDAQGNSKVARITYMVQPQQEVVWLGSLDEVVDSSEQAAELVENIYGKKLAQSDSDYSYYEANGATYQKVYAACTQQGNAATGKTEYHVRGAYAYVKDQITFDSCYHRVYWSPVSNVTEIEQNGKIINIGYQVKVNGEVVGLDDFAYYGSELQSITTDVSYRHPVLRMAGESANYEVRAVYYTTDVRTTTDLQTGEDVATVTKYIVNVGDWSNVYTYAWEGTKQTIPTVSNLSYRQRSTEVAELSWDKVDVASAYRIQYLYSAEPITDFSNVNDQWWEIDKIYDTTFQVKNDDYGTGTVVDANGQKRKVDYKYAYYRVAAYLTYDSQDFAHSVGAYSDIVCVPENSVINTPQITGLQVQYQTDGTFDLKWDSIDHNAHAVVYYSTDKSVFNTPEYLYRLVTAKAFYDNGTETTTDDKWIYYVDTYPVANNIVILDKKVKSVYCADGANTINSSEFSMVPGKTYYFAVVTYDNANYNTDRSAFTPYVANVTSTEGKTKAVAFGYYSDVMASKVVSAKSAISILEPSTKSDKTSISITFDKTADNNTGYEIYRKNGKKFKKIATTTSCYYVDSNLKKDTVYNYKARAYYYNPDTKDKAYSDYVYFSAETCASNNMELKIDKKSKTSVKLAWNKVSGATKYEIYRSNTASTGTTISEKNGYGNGEYALSNKQWELVKTIKKASTTSYTDKKLQSGETYYYRVVAYYKSGKKEKSIFATDYIELKLAAPRDVKVSIKGSSAKVTWKKEIYASKYEVGYRIYDVEGNRYTDDWISATTKKNSYTIKNIAAGDLIVIRVRAYGSNKWSPYSEACEENAAILNAVQKVTVKEITETNSKGEKNTRVKISWKAVPGAAYYVVTRSYSPSIQYNVDNKSYIKAYGDSYYISKEDNGDEAYGHVPYEEYKGEQGTIVGTSAIDRCRLQTGVTYYYYVEAYSHDGELVSKGYNKPASICYKATPSIKKVTAKKGKTIVSINKVSGAKKYVIYRSTKKNSGYKQIGTTTKTTYTDKTTKKGKTYYYKVVAVGKNALKADFESNKSKAVKVKAK